MYEKFRCEVLTQIGSVDSETLKMVADAMDTVAAYYKIERAENALSVVGRDEFLEIAATYVIVRKTEGIKDGTLEHMTRIMRQGGETTMYDDPDFCNDCSGIGDDYYFDENGELVNACEDCPYYNS